MATEERRGAPKGNKNAAGNKGGGAPRGNTNAMKHGLHAEKYWWRLWAIYQRMKKEEDSL